MGLPVVGTKQPRVALALPVCPWRMSFQRSTPKMKTPRDKPVAALRRFAALLGWSSLRVYQHTLEDYPKPGESRVVTWYESGDRGNPRTDCFLAD